MSKVANHETHLTDLVARAAELQLRQGRHRAEVEILVTEEGQLEAARAQVLDRVGYHRQSAHDLQNRRTDEESELGRTREEGKLGRSLYVAKHRGSACGDEIRPYSLTDAGLVFD